MKVLRGIDRPVSGEHVLDVVPPLLHYTDFVEELGPIAPRTRKRLALFTRRAVTHIALTREQRSRGNDLAWLAQACAPGVITGFEAAIEGDALAVMPGRALTARGEDMEMAYPLRIAIDSLPVYVGGAAWNAKTLAELRAADPALAALPRALVLTAVPLSIAIDRSGELNSPCPNAVGSEAFSELAWEDGFQLAWVPWPADRTLPPWTADGDTLDPRFRNRLAYAVFAAEREQAYGAAQGDAIRWPWERHGVALAVVGFGKGFRAEFADRSAVVRQGGGRRNRSPLIGNVGDDVLWQARVAQLVEHLAELPPEALQAANLARQFDFLPPAGILPKDAADFGAARQFVFPASFDVQAQPVPLDMVDALIAESSSLSPFNLSARDQVQILVPVPSRFFEPDLLRLDETIHPLFDSEIRRLEAGRLELLTRRDGLRRRADAFGKAIRGEYPKYPQDDPEALPDETGALDAAMFARVHAFSAAAGQSELHGFSGAKARLAIAPSDSLFVFVRLDGMPAGVELGVQYRSGNQARVRRLFWGEPASMPAGSVPVGPLPEATGWTRLEVPAAVAGIAGESLDGIDYAVFAGAAPCSGAWGYAGTLSNGFESYWVGDALPAGARSGGDWRWAVQGAPLADVDDAAIGLPLDGDAREIAELDNLVAAYRNAPGGLVRELGEAWVVKATKEGATDTVAASNEAPLPEQGLNRLIDRLSTRIAAADDHVEFGFLRARTDIFRVRQAVLGTENAGRLLTSPAASELIQRTGGNLVASEKEFDAYFKKAAATPVPAAATTRSVEALPERSTRGPVEKPVAERAVETGKFSAAAAISADKRSSVESVRFAGEAVAPDAKAPAKSLDKGAAEVIAGDKVGARLAGVSAAPTVTDVVGTSLFGTTLNTVTVGERLAGSAAVETKNAAAAGKASFVTGSLDMLNRKGIALEGIEISGFQTKGTTDKLTSAAEVIAASGAGTLEDADSLDLATTEQHEAGYFKRGLDAIDNMVRFLRGVEIRAADYRRLQADAIAARDRMGTVVGRLQAMIDALNARLAEVRHDLSVARSLRAEEVARVEALVSRRRSILAEHVPYLVFRRPRFTRTLVDVPVLAVQPAVVADPVPKCRDDDHGVPPELQSMVETLKDVPARWFRKVHPLIERFDRIESLQELVDVSRARLDRSAAAKKVELVEGADTKSGRALGKTFERHALRMDRGQEETRKLLPQLEGGSWKSALESVRRIATVGDLIRAKPPSRQSTLEAAGELDDIAGVAGCLYAAFSEVPPATRLRWAEILSELDSATSLRSLTVLPGFGDEGLGVDYIRWRQMQMMADWLFSRIEAEDDAVDAINDLVRVALLLAAHAPVRRIISARVRRPVRPVLDAHIELDLDPRVARIGMQVLVHAPLTKEVVARAVIEDIGTGQAVAKISQVMKADVTIDATMRVQLQSGPALSTPAAAKADAKAAAPSAAKQSDAQANRRVMKAMRETDAAAGRGKVLRK